VNTPQRLGQILIVFGMAHPIIILKLFQNFKLLLLFSDEIWLPETETRAHTDIFFYYTDITNSMQQNCSLEAVIHSSNQ
jgi:hypothetical protein